MNFQVIQTMVNLAEVLSRQRRELDSLLTAYVAAFAALLTLRRSEVYDTAPVLRALMAPLADFQAVPLRHALEVQCANLQPDVGTLPVFPRLTGLASHFAGGRVVTSWAGRLSNYEVVAVWQTVNALRFMLTAEQAEGVYEALEGRFRLLVADCEPSVTTRQFAWFEAIRSVPTVRPRVTKATLKVIRGGHD